MQTICATNTMEEEGRPSHSTRMQSILEASQIIIEDGDMTGHEEVSTLTGRTRGGGSIPALGGVPLLPNSQRQGISDAEYRKSLSIVRSFEAEARRKSGLTVVHIAMLRKHVNEMFFPRFKFLPSKGNLIDKMKTEVERVFTSIEIHDPNDMQTFAFDLQRKLRFMVSQRRSFVVNRIFDLYKGKNHPLGR